MPTRTLSIPAATAAVYAAVSAAGVMALVTDIRANFTPAGDAISVTVEFPSHLADQDNPTQVAAQLHDVNGCIDFHTEDGRWLYTTWQLHEPIGGSPLSPLVIERTVRIEINPYAWTGDDGYAHPDDPAGQLAHLDAVFSNERLAESLTDGDLGLSDLGDDATVTFRPVDQPNG